MLKEGQNHIGYIYLFAINLTPLTPSNGIGVNWSFIFRKRGKNHTKQKGGVNSPLALKTRVRTPKPLRYYIV
jgi:hypothetical protein